MVIIVGGVLSISFTYWLMNDWRKDFTYRIDLSIDLFVLRGIISIFIALITITFHALKVSMMNPADTIRFE